VVLTERGDSAVVKYFVLHACVVLDVCGEIVQAGLEKQTPVKVYLC
jgi:hypothetical protein